MKPVEQPLYPKLSSIYNKILQLVSAILLIVVLMTIWLSSVEKSQRTITEHFQQTSQQFLQQAIVGTSVILEENLVNKSKKTRDALLQKYLNKLAEAKFVRDIHLYDETGLLLLSSEHQDYSATSIKLLYGIDKAQKTLNKSEQFLPFIAEIRHQQLTGYLRITFEKSLMVSSLEKESHQQQSLFRILLIVAGLVGFLLTRGLNRFSRQGFRLPNAVTEQH